MRIALLSDIHSNWPALKAVAHDLEKRNVDYVYVLGDTIGYCAHPIECIDWVRNNADMAVAGNHEAMLAFGQAFNDANGYAQEAMNKNREIVTEEQMLFLKSLPLILIDWAMDLSIAHANISYSEGFDYVMDESMAMDELQLSKTRFLAIGHTHQPRLFSTQVAPVRVTGNREIDVRDGGKYLIDVGSVGQPRDGDCRACYVILEVNDQSAKCSYHRVFYRIDQTVMRMRRQNYTEVLQERLFLGQ